MNWIDRLRGAGKEIDSIARNQEPTSSTDSTTEVKPEPTPPEDYYTTHLRNLVLEKEHEVLKRRDTLLQELHNDHKGQVEGFQFIAQRLGDWLSVMIIREYNATYYRADGQKYKTRFSTAISLALNGAFNVIPGRPVALRGETYYSLNIVRDDGTMNLVFDVSEYSKYRKGGFEIIPPPEGSRYEVYASSMEQDCIGPRVFSNVDDEYTGGLWIRKGTRTRVLNGIDIVTKNTPAAAIDDTIHFVGQDIKFYVPYGTGEEVKMVILAAIAAGYEHASIPGSPPPSKGR
jgi:hypothetical protein